MNIDRSESKDFEVSEACMRYQGLYIALLRAKDYLWGVPAGKLEFRETPLGGIVPEIRAEIGLQIFPKYVTLTYHKYPGFSFAFHLFAHEFTQNLSKKMRLNSHALEFRLLTLSQAKKLSLI